ncbi:hypothetical protein [Haloarcula sp. Atlit-7R]|uniref:hypothetical protein n=1 Tax=Haloarcula sp. Atlit-7R TaxID=2282125 RepID=UPI001F1BE6F5|nr:hypothetical protein [Haloarcula sp. Atlit-7R]
MFADRGIDPDTGVPGVVLQYKCQPGDKKPEIEFIENGSIVSSYDEVCQTQPADEFSEHLCREARKGGYMPPQVPEGTDIEISTAVLSGNCDSAVLAPKDAIELVKHRAEIEYNDHVRGYGANDDEFLEQFNDALTELETAFDESVSTTQGSGSDSSERVTVESSRKSLEILLSAAEERLAQLDDHPQMMAKPAELGAAIKDIRQGFEPA